MSNGEEIWEKQIDKDFGWNEVFLENDSILLKFRTKINC
jgi:hypothetical protein